MRRGTLSALVLVVGCGGPINTGQDGGPADATIDSTSCAANPFLCWDGAVQDGGPPAPVLCPENAPDAGTPCNVPDYEDCEYGVTTAFNCSLHLFCSSGQWTVFKPPTCKPQTCPDAPPDGGGCTSWGEECAYGDAGVFCVCSLCGGGPPPPDGYTPTWQCRTPAPGCSLVRPDDGTACDLDGGICNYSAGACCTGATSVCRGGVWLGAPTDVCP